VKYSVSNERKLLRLLADCEEESGLFFARWDEIRQQNYSPDYIAGIEGAPDLSFENERCLKFLLERGLVEDLPRLATKEGRHFKITLRGMQELERSSTVGKLSRLLSGIWGFFLALQITALIGLGIAIFTLLDRSVVCDWPFASYTEKCNHQDARPDQNQQ